MVIFSSRIIVLGLKQVVKVNCRTYSTLQSLINIPFKMTPAGVLENYDLRKLSPQNLKDKCAHLVKTIQDNANKVASTEVLSKEKVLKPILEAWRLYGENFLPGGIITLPSKVAESEELRNASTEAQKILSDAFVEMEMRKDVFDNLVKYRQEVAGKEDLSAEEKRALDRLILNGRRNGLELNEEIRANVKNWTKEINSLATQFTKALGEEKSKLLFTKEELKGLDEDEVFLNSLDKDPETGKYILTLKYPHYIPAMRKCILPETRRRLEFAYNSRAKEENSPLLEKIAELREKKAAALGYPTFAAFEQEILMAKNPETVQAFLTDLAEKLKPLWKKEKEFLLALKKEECEKYNLEFDGKLNMWDLGYFMNRATERNYSVDKDKLKEYFPYEVVTEGLLNIYQDLLGLTFTLLPDAPKWHDDVLMYQVTDKKTEETMGYFYLDMFPREGKYGHACCVALQQGCLNESGVKLPAVAALVCNFPRPMGDQPALFSHDDVETYFHEFGHCMHVVLSRAETALFFGYNVSSDFIEAPSQMLENWVWQKESLQRMSGHYKTKEPIPDELLENLLRSRLANTGGFNLRQIVFSTIDQRMHQHGRYELSKMYADVLKEIMDMDATPGTNAMSGFAHMCDQYEAKYYGYLWSEVYCQDMFETVFESSGIMNPDAGEHYRKVILEPGGSVDSMELLKKFLGNKEPSNAAFLRSKGI